MEIERHNPKRRHLLGESRLLSEYIRDRYAGRAFHSQLPIGASPGAVGVDYLDEAEERMARRLNRRVDAVIVPPPELVVIEATMSRPSDKVGRLIEYLLLLPATPEYRNWAGAPVVVELVTAQDDEVARKMCALLGFRYVFYEPDWIDEFHAVYPRRKRRSPHAGLVQRAAEMSLLSRTATLPPPRGP